jgi:ABC-type Fe3+-hydroxamate transport system substrate-binding protein
MGREVDVPTRPRRIVSLVPSQTELLFDLGAGDRVVGATRFCVHPSGPLATVPRVGGTKQIHLDALARLEPDLVIGNKEENERTQIEAIADRYPVWLSDVGTLDEALAMIESVGFIVGAAERATSLLHEIRHRFASLPGAGGERVAYLIWRRPWMGVGSGTFIDDMLGRCGFVNVLAEQGLDRYPELTDGELRDAAPELVLLSSEPFPFTERHFAEIAGLLPGARIRLVDGEAFSWYGSRLALAAEVLSRLVESERGA